MSFWFGAGVGALIGWLIGTGIGIYASHVYNKQRVVEEKAKARKIADEAVGLANQMSAAYENQLSISEQKDKVFESMTTLCNEILDKSRQYEGQNNQIAEELRVLQAKYERVLALWN